MGGHKGLLLFFKVLFSKSSIDESKKNKGYCTGYFFESERAIFYGLD